MERLATCLECEWTGCGCLIEHCCCLQTDCEGHGFDELETLRTQTIRLLRHQKRAYICFQTKGLWFIRIKISWNPQISHNQDDKEYRYQVKTLDKKNMVGGQTKYNLLQVAQWIDAQHFSKCSRVDFFSQP